MQPSPIFVLLPVATGGTLALLFARDGATGLIKTHVVVFAFVAVVTETLSAFHWIDFPHLLGTWMIAFLGCALAIGIGKSWRHALLARHAFREMTTESIVSFGVIFLILVATFATAILYPPNNWDSMAYHMARIPHWMVNHSVAFYPTEIGRQNYPAPLAEFAILHLQILSGTDLFANLVQWTCFGVSILLGVLIAAELSVNRRGQLVAAVLIATIPMAILQSTSTQNDLVVTSFVLVFALFMLRLSKAFNVENLLFASLGLGLALLTKGTSYIYSAAVGLALAVPILRPASFDFALLLRRTGGLALLCLIALALNSGHLARTCRLYGSPVFMGENRTANEDCSISALLGNIPRNLALHFGTSMPRLNDAIDRTLRRVIGAQLDNRDNSYLKIPFSLNPYRRHEDFAGNPIHLLVALLALALALVGPRGQIQQRTWYAIAVLAGASLYCFCLKWQPWSSRLHLPLFALSAPLIAIAVTRLPRKIERYLVAAVMVLTTLYSIPFVLRNELRPLLTKDWKNKERARLYFTYRPELYQGYKQAIDLLEQSSARDVGLYIGGDGWEYPFWALGKDSAMQFRHVGLTEQSKVLETNTSLPE